MDPLNWLTVSTKCSVLTDKAVVRVVATVVKTLKAADFCTPQCKSKIITQKPTLVWSVSQITLPSFIGCHLM